MELPLCLELVKNRIIARLEKLYGVYVYVVYVDGELASYPMPLCLKFNGHDNCGYGGFIAYRSIEQDPPRIFFYVYDKGDALVCNSTYLMHNIKKYIPQNVPYEEMVSGIYEHIE